MLTTAIFTLNGCHQLLNIHQNGTITGEVDDRFSGLATFAPGAGEDQTPWFLVLHCSPIVVDRKTDKTVQTI